MSATVQTRFEAELAALRSHVAELECAAEADRSTPGELLHLAELLESVVHHAPIVLWSIDVDGIFTLSKGHGLSVLNLKPDEVVGQSIFDLYGEYTEIVADIRRALAGEEFRSRVEVDGLFFDTTFIPIFAEPSKVIGVRGVSTVVTHQVRVEREYRETQQRYETLAHIAPVGIFHTDVQENCLYANEQWCSVSGLSPAEGQRRGWICTLHPDDHTRVVAEWSRAVGSGQAFRSEFRFRRTDGVTTWILGQAVPETNAAGAVTSYVGTVTGITAQKQIEEVQRRLNLDLESRVQQRTEALRMSDLTLQEQIHERKRILEELLESQARWRSVVEDAPDIIVTIERDGTIRYINRSLPPLEQADAVGRKVFEFIPEDHHLCSKALISSVFETGEPVSDELAAQETGGRQAWYSCRIGPVKRGDEVVSLTIVARDITRQKQAEERARQRQLELAHVSRVSTMGEMATILAHELNQPLAAIANYADGCIHRIHSQQIDAARLVEPLEDIGRQATRAGETIRRLREFLQNCEVRRAIVDLDELVQEAVKLADPEARHYNVKIEVQSADWLPALIGNRIQIEQVLFNLLVNGIESIERARDTRRFITVRTRTESDEHVGVSVIDTGSGLPGNFEDWIFEPFQSTKPHGLGMGLSRRTATAYGRVRLRPAVRRFTSTYRHEQEANQMTNDTTETTVFVVDDDPAIRKSLRWLVESVGFSVQTFSSAMEFLDGYDPTVPGCLVLDMRMQGLSGLELQEKLCRESPQIPIIVLTGYGDVPMAIRAIKNGAFDFLEKPMSDHVLLKHIQSALARDRENRQRISDQKDLCERFHRLTHREREVVQPVSEGLSSRQIGEELGVSFKTIDSYRSKIMKKMKAKNLPHRVRLSLEASTEGG